jgi:hypothetical protein
MSQRDEAAAAHQAQTPAAARIGTPAEWRDARLDLLAREKELDRRRWVSWRTLARSGAERVYRATRGGRQKTKHCHHPVAVSEPLTRGR